MFWACLIDVLSLKGTEGEPDPLEKTTEECGNTQNSAVLLKTNRNQNEEGGCATNSALCPHLRQFRAKEKHI
jgi:hypothetical protein